MQRKNVHLLLIEDNSRFLKELLAWLHDFGYEEIVTATSAADSMTQLENPCDIVVADMRMEQDDSGFLILDWVKKRNLSAVVIILTANDTVSDCRRAFREGAWDYISKNMSGNSFEELDSSIQAAVSYLDRWGNRPNQQWFEENRAELESTYWGQWIAIVNRAVIETAESEKELLLHLEERKLRRFTTTIQQIGDFRPILELLSLGESDRIEFKSSLEWDVRQCIHNKNLHRSVLKTIAAFHNSEGGTLIVGVEDDGKIFGLAKDLGCLSNGSLDKFERHLTQLIENNMGKRILSCIKIRFANIENNDVCAIYVRPATQRVFLKSEKSANSVELYSRVGNKTIALNVPDIYEYL